MVQARRVATAGVSTVRDVARWRRGEPSSADTYLAMRWLHRKTGGRSSRVALTALRSVPGSVDRAAPALPLAPGTDQALAALEADGVVVLPPILDADAVARVREFARTAPGRERTVDGTQRGTTYAARSTDAASVAILEQFLLDQPDIQGIMASPLVTSLARRYFGIGAVVHPPQLYWSCTTPSSASPETAATLARLFHWDYDGVAGLRLHMYLTDVDESTAPMEYLPGSHRLGALPSHALRHADLGAADVDVWSAFAPSDVRTITGPAGTTFLSDSQGLHRGTTPRSGDRLFLVMPLQATGFAGYQFGRRQVTPRHPDLDAVLRARRPEYRLFTGRP